MQSPEHIENKLGRWGLLILLGYILALVLHPSLLTDYLTHSKGWKQIVVTHEVKH